MSPSAARAARKYLPLVLGIPGCLGAGWFELTRALAGREIAWVYTFEWPFYAVAGTYMWWQIWHRDPAARSARGSSVAQGNSRSRARPAAELPDDDPELAAWQLYRANLDALDPPGGPPQRT